MKNLINKSISSLSLAIPLIMSSISQETLANDKKLQFLSSNNSTAVVLNSKPPYFRKRTNMERKKSQQSIKAYTLSPDSNVNVKVLSKNRRKTCIGRHPDVTKRHSKRC